MKVKLIFEINLNPKLFEAIDKCEGQMNYFKGISEGNNI